MPCPILYILTARINITGSNKEMKKKDRQTEIHGQKAGNLGS